MSANNKYTVLCW